MTPIKDYNFLKSLENVQLNFRVPQEGDTHWFELSYIAGIFRKLEQWDAFSSYSFKLIAFRYPFSFSIDPDDIVFYVSNETHIVPQEISERARLVFTANYPFGNNVPANIYTIPLNYNGSVPELPTKSIEERTNDVFFSGKIHRRRVQFYFGCQKLKFASKFRNPRPKLDILFTRKFASGYPPEEYAKHLMNASIALAPPGWFSSITHRFFEAVRFGNVVISCELPDHWYFKPFPGIVLKNWCELDKCVNQLLISPNKMQQIHQETLMYYQDYCTEQAVSNYVKSVILKSNDIEA